MLKKIVIGFSGLLLVLFALAGTGIYWALKFIPGEQEQQTLRVTQAHDIVYLQSALPATRGKILAIVTSTRELGNTGRLTGYELTELARAYWVFTANGFMVDIASPEGGEPYALLDDDDMGVYDYAFLNDPSAQHKAKNTFRLGDVKAEDYQALYFVGGKGAMFDFPDNPDIHKLVASFAEQNKIIAAVCHGPAALVNVKRSDGDWFVTNRTVSAFTNSEELLLIPYAEKIFPFLLQKKLEERGAKFIAGQDYLEQVTVDDKLITGQNPWSVWRIAEETVKLLGYEPLPRAITSEEHSIALLKIYQQQGLEKAEKVALGSGHDYSGHLLLMHSFVAFIKWELLDGVALMILADGVRSGGWPDGYGRRSS